MKKKVRKPILYGFISGAIVFVLVFLFVIISIYISTSSTAALGFLIIPFFGLPLALLSFFVVWIVAFIYFKIRKKKRVVRRK